MRNDQAPKGRKKSSHAHGKSRVLGLGLIWVLPQRNPVFTPQPIGHVRSPYTTTQQIPKGLGARHEAEGTLNILPQFDPGLTDIEGFSHLIVLWVFDRAGRFELVGSPPSDN